MRTIYRGKTVRSVYHKGQQVKAILNRGKARFIAGDQPLDMLFNVNTRVITESGSDWLEVSLDLNLSEVPLTGSPSTYWDASGYLYLYMEWRSNKTQWQRGKFIASPLGNETLSGGATRIWNRAIHPKSSTTATAAELVCESTAATGDTRNGPFTGMSVGGVAVSLPNAPYTMPTHAAALQTDLRAAGYANATVTAASNVDWKITLKNLTFGEDQSAEVRFPAYHYGIVKGFRMNRSKLDFQGDRIDAASNVIAYDGFARFCTLPGTRYGNAVLRVPVHPVDFAPLTENPFEGLEIGSAITPDPLTSIPTISYPITRITGSRSPGATLTRPTYVWVDPGWTSLTIVGTWYKNGVATSSHGATYVATTDGTYTYREVATNENGVSVSNDLAWLDFIVSQVLIDAGLDNPNWLAPYVALADGTEGDMIRFLDDPDVPCYQGVWLKADKNRFHQARGPGSAKKYVRNPNLWAAAFSDSLTGVCVANDYSNPEGTIPDENWMTKRGGTLLTNQHIVSCGHGPPGISTSGFPARIRFLGTDGNIYERLIVGQKFCIGGYGAFYEVTIGGVQHAADSWIGTLDSPLPSAVKVLRIIPDNFKRFFAGGNNYDFLFVSQSMENESNSIYDTPVKSAYYPYNKSDYSPSAYHPNYPSRQRTMCCTVSDKYPATKYFPWGGDSGQPKFLATGTELLFAGFCGGGGAGPDFYPQIQDGVSITWEALANKMIADADADAIARGALTAPTGKTVTVFTL